MAGREDYRIQLHLSRPADPFYPPTMVTASGFDAPETYEEFLSTLDGALREVYDAIAFDRGKSTDEILGAAVEAKWACIAAASADGKDALA